MSNRKLRFRAAIDIRGINPYVLVSAERAGKLKPDWRKPMPVRIQINGKPDVPWRINMMPTGDGSFFLYLHAQVRNASGTAVGDVCRQLGISEATFYVWKKRYGHLGVNEVRRVRQLEDENARLKRLVADLTLDKHMLAEALRRKS